MSGPTNSVIGMDKSAVLLFRNQGWQAGYTRNWTDGNFKVNFVSRDYRKDWVAFVHNGVYDPTDPAKYLTKVNNPITGQPYAPNIVLRGDFTRCLTEFWADGPSSETPPGHWNLIANQVSDNTATLQIGGTSPVVDRLEWDVKLYFAVNAAVHDAACACWSAKRDGSIAPAIKRATTKMTTPSFFLLFSFISAISDIWRS